MPRREVSIISVGYRSTSCRVISAGLAQELKQEGVPLLVLEAQRRPSRS